MQTFLLISWMVLVGALIGGLTNFIAIRMLFRPYKALKIGKWTVPFTPGLIPRRRNEIAVQLGKMVDDHLLTADGLTNKVMSPLFEKEVTSLFKKNIEQFLQSDRTIAQISEEKLGVSLTEEKVKELTKTFLEKKYELFFSEHHGKAIEECIPQKLNLKITNNIPQIAQFIVARGAVYVESQAGKEQINKLIQRFLERKGKLINMISMFLSEEKLSALAEQELLKFLRDEHTPELVETILVNEWEKYKKQEIEMIEAWLQKDELIKFAVDTLIKEVPVYTRLSQPLNEWTAEYTEKLNEKILPNVVKAILQYASSHMAKLLKQLRLNDIVEDQVKSFSLQQLEVLVISIAKRELKMITFLGAVLGGVIGFIQSMTVLFAL